MWKNAATNPTMNPKEHELFNCYQSKTTASDCRSARGKPLTQVQQNQSKSWSVRDVRVRINRKYVSRRYMDKQMQSDTRASEKV